MLRSISVRLIVAKLSVITTESRSKPDRFPSGSKFDSHTAGMIGTRNIACDHCDDNLSQSSIKLIGLNDNCWPCFAGS